MDLAISFADSLAGLNSPLQLLQPGLARLRRRLGRHELRRVSAAGRNTQPTAARHAAHRPTLLAPRQAFIHRLLGRQFSGSLLLGELCGGPPLSNQRHDGPPIEPLLSAERCNDCPQVIPVLTRDGLNGRAYQLLPQALREETSVFVQQTTSAHASPIIRGFTGQGNAYLVDGVTNQETLAGEPRQDFPQGGIQEFKVNAHNDQAEFGSTLGGIVNVATKSGTNELHGTAFEYIRNSALDARNFFDRGKPDFRRHQFGFTSGGPLVRGRSFFFGSYEGLCELKGITAGTLRSLWRASASIGPEFRRDPANRELQDYLAGSVQRKLELVRRAAVMAGV